MANISWGIGKELTVGTGVGEVVAFVSAIAAAQQFGSALRTWSTHEPLRELIHAVNNGTDIAARRYHGNDVYDKEDGKIMTMRGEIKTLAMNKVVTVKDENPSLLSTIIVCLSVAMNRDQLSTILASSIMIFAHGKMDRPMESTIRVLQAKIKKYAAAVLSRDSMCEKLKSVRAKQKARVKSRAPGIPVANLFQGPQFPAEEGDFAEFLAELWNAQGDGVMIFTRSVKLLGLALLLSEYGWQIDTMVEDETGHLTPIQTDTKALSVIFSLSKSELAGREYVENHRRYLTVPNKDFYPTATCTAAHMGEVSGMSVATSSQERDNFERGYEMGQSFCNKYGFTIKLEEERIYMVIESQQRHGVSTLMGERDCKSLISRFLPRSMPDKVRDLISKALCSGQPSDWHMVTEQILKQSNPDASLLFLLHYYKDLPEVLWTVLGAILGVLDKVIEPLVNIPPESTVRTPTSSSVDKFIEESGQYLQSLLNTGLEPGHAVQLCAARLAGVDPKRFRNSTETTNRKVVGFWNAQQGVLLTPIFERSLYCDLPEEKARPLTFFNIPIEGMPADDEGWIRPGPVDSPLIEQRREAPLRSTGESRRSAIIIEYRPHFEGDSTNLAAAVYVEGVLYGLLNIQNTLSTLSHVVALDCNHQEPPGQVLANVVDLRDFQYGRIHAPRSDNEVLIIGPQQDHTSRLFSSTIYDAFLPVVQKGCLACAIDLARQTDKNIVIPKGHIDDLSLSSLSIVRSSPSEAVIR